MKYEPKVVKTAAMILKTAAEWSPSKGEKITMSFASEADLAHGSCDISYYRRKPSNCDEGMNPCTEGGEREDNKPEITVSYNGMEAPQALAIFTEMKAVLDRAIEKITKLTDGKPASGEERADSSAENTQISSEEGE